MFTGIITELGTVSALRHHPDTDSARLTLHAPTSGDGLEPGGSLSVNGSCLTAVTLDGGAVTVDVMGETLRRTTVGSLRPGDPVNLERCLPAGGRFDGHIVQGHVDAAGAVTAVEDHGGWRRMRVQIPADLAGFVAEKGSVAVDGVSLTVTAVSDPPVASAGDETWFEVGLIPETLQRTTLGVRGPGDAVNLEVDVIARYAARLAQTAAVGATTRPAGARPAGVGPA